MNASTIDGRTRLLGLLDAGDPRGEVRTAWHAKEVVRGLYDHTDPDLAVAFVERLGHDLQDESCPVEVRSLGRTLIRWQDQIAAWHRAHVSQRADRSANNLIKRVKRVAFGFTRWRNYRIRVLLYAGRTQLGPTRHHHTPRPAPEGGQRLELRARHLRPGRGSISGRRRRTKRCRCGVGLPLRPTGGTRSQGRPLRAAPAQPRPRPAPARAAGRGAGPRSVRQGPPSTRSPACNSTAATSMSGQHTPAQAAPWRSPNRTAPTVAARPVGGRGTVRWQRRRKILFQGDICQPAASTRVPARTNAGVTKRLLAEMAASATGPKAIQIAR